jgi:hypothetical protein
LKKIKIIGEIINMKQTGNRFAGWSAVVLLLCSSSFTSLMAAEETTKEGSLAAGLDYERARWHPIHFKPAIDDATDEQCLSCHQEILEPRVKQESLAGVKTENTLAWYQTLETYEGEQDTFHRRHLVTPLAKKVMNLKCNFCHQGNSPREEAPIPPTDESAGFTLRKMVDPTETCLKCHGRHNYEIMGLPGSWPETREAMANSCLTCHVAVRTNRHQVTYLNAKAIEKAGEENSDVCYGCHGGRQWYRYTYPYPRNPWVGQAEEVPEWAKDRPTQSEARFQLDKTAETDTPQ